VIVHRQGQRYTRRRRGLCVLDPVGFQPFTAALVMQNRAADAIKEKIGVERPGRVNSILATQIIPQVSVNPLVNSGAIASVSMVQATSADEALQQDPRFLRCAVGRQAGR